MQQNETVKRQEIAKCQFFGDLVVFQGCRYVLCAQLVTKIVFFPQRQAQCSGKR